MPQQINVPVAIVGAGPVGLALALGLARHGVPSTLLERNDSTSRTSRAPAIHVRTREVLRQWRVEDAFLDRGSLLQPLTLHSVEPPADPLATVDFSIIADEAHQPGLLVLEQSETERLLLDAVRETGLCDVRFGTEVTGLVQRPTSVSLECRTGAKQWRLASRYAVGCDGAASFVRGALGMPFDGLTYRLRPVLADVHIDERIDLPWPRVWTGSGAFAFTVCLRPGLWRIVDLQHGPAHEDADDVTHADVAPCVRRLLGDADFELAWGSRFRIHRRAAPAFRAGNVFLAGDAAHVHSPASGQGMNSGIHDAHNLAWKLAAALHDADDERLLDSYDVERRSVTVGSTSRYTDRVTRAFIQAPRLVRNLAWTTFRTALGNASLSRRIVRRVAMIDLDYAVSPLLDNDDLAAGVRLPDPVLVAPDGTQARLHDLLPVGPALLRVGSGPGRPDGPPARTGNKGPIPPVIGIGDGGWADHSGLLRKLLGSDDGVILVRPDTHVAWARTDPSSLTARIRSSVGGTRT